MPPIKSAISFGTFHVPVRIHGAVKDISIHFNQLHKKDNQRVKERKECSHCGRELTSSDIIRGFDVGNGKYITVTDQELESLKTKKDRSIKVEHTMHLDEVSPAFYEKATHLTPEPMGERIFELFRASLMKCQLVALGRVVMSGNSETIVLLIPRDEGLICQTIRYAEEIRDFPSYTKPEPAAQEMELMGTILKQMEQPFEPEKYHDEHQHKIMELIEAKQRNQDYVVADYDQMDPTGDNVISILDQLTAMAKENQQADGGGDKRKKGTRRKKKVSGA